MQKKFILITACCVLAFATGCAKQNDYDTLQQQVSTQNQQLRQLQPGMADTWSQLQAMRQELNALKGQLDDLNAMGGAKNLVDTVNRHDAALRQVERSLALNLNLDAPLTTPMGMEGSMESGMEGGIGSDGVYSDGMPQNRGTLTLNPVPPQPPVAQAPQADMATALYNAGVSSFNARQYSQAQRSFSDFTKNYPQNPQAGNAWYYVGECYFQLNKFNDAALAYDKVINSFPKSSSVPGAYLKQGISFSKLGQKAAATARLQELIKKFPTSAEASRAKSFLQTNS